MYATTGAAPRNLRIVTNFINRISQTNSGSHRNILHDIGSKVMFYSTFNELMKEKYNCEISDARVAARHGLGSGSPAYVVQGSEFEDDRDNKGEQITIGISNVET